MEKLILTIITLSFVFATPCKAGDPKAATNDYELAYQQWRAAIGFDTYFYDSTDYRSPELVAAVAKIKSFGLKFGEFICEKMATAPGVVDYSVYNDMLLMEDTTGIHLNKGGPMGNFYARIAAAKARYREEWRSGVYEHPDQKVAELLEPLIKQESVRKVTGRDVLDVRKYGVYGIPELIRHIKKHNSSSAFMAYVTVTGQMELYRKYMPEQMFVTKEEKLKHIEKKVKEWKDNGDDKHPVVIKIHAALKE